MNTTKTNTMKITRILAILILITIAILGNIFAKYITTSTISDTARVAKWEIATPTTLDLFNTQYSNGDNEVMVTGDDENVIAPGTSGTYTFQIVSGSENTEVAYTLAAEVNASYTGGWGDWNPNGPLLFAFNDKENLTLAGLASEITEYATNLDIVAPNATIDAKTISWSWPFYVNESQDLMDTVAGQSTAAPSVNIEIKITATQVSV